MRLALEGAPDAAGAELQLAGAAGPAITASIGRRLAVVASPNGAPNEPAWLKDAAVRIEASLMSGCDGVLLDRPFGAATTDGAQAIGFDEWMARRYGARFVLSAAGAMPRDGLTGHRRAHVWEELRAASAGLAVSARERGRRLGRPILVGARFDGPSALAVEFARRLDLVLMQSPAPAPERARLSSYELMLSTLEPRPLVAMLGSDAAHLPGRTAQAARLAASVGVSLALGTDAPRAALEALEAHREAWERFRRHSRPQTRFAEVLLPYVPVCDQFTGGLHGSGVRAVAEALTQLGVQHRIVATLPPEGTEPVVIVDAHALPEAEAMRLERRVSSGASALVVGGCGTVDEIGRPRTGPFPTLTGGLGRHGQGTVLGVALSPPADGVAERRYEPLLSPLSQALESLMGRGRRATTVTGAELIVKARLDPEKKLDLMLVGRRFDPSTGAAAHISGAVVHISGALAGPAPTGVLLTEDGREKKVSLTAFGLGVRASLPDFSGSAILTVAR